jgi:hypothetical protein
MLVHGILAVVRLVSKPKNYRFYQRLLTFPRFSESNLVSFADAISNEAVSSSTSKMS